MSLWNSMAQTNIKDTYADISQIAVKKTIASQVICDAETRESEKENEKLFRCSFCEAISDGCWQTLPHLVWSVFTFFFFHFVFSRNTNTHFGLFTGAITLKMDSAFYNAHCHFIFELNVFSFSVTLPISLYLWSLLLLAVAANFDLPK